LEAQFLLAAAAGLKVPALGSAGPGLAVGARVLRVLGGGEAGQRTGARSEKRPAIAGAAVALEPHDDPFPLADVDRFARVAQRKRDGAVQRVRSGGNKLFALAVEEAQLVIPGTHEIARHVGAVGVELVHGRFLVACRSAHDLHAARLVQGAVPLARPDIRFPDLVARGLASRLARIQLQIRADAGAIGARQDARVGCEQVGRVGRRRCTARTGAADHCAEGDQGREEIHGGRLRYIGALSFARLAAPRNWTLCLLHAHFSLSRIARPITQSLSLSDRNFSSSVKWVMRWLQLTRVNEVLVRSVPQ